MEPKLIASRQQAPLLNFLVLCLGAWLSCAGNVWSDEATWAPRQAVALHVDGKYLKDDAGHIVRLQGVHTTPQPYFTGGGAIWNNHDFEGCLNYMRSLVDVLTDPSPRYGTTHGWYGNQIRMDPAVSYWANSSTTPVYPMEKLKEVTDRILVPLAEYAERKGLYGTSLAAWTDVPLVNGGMVSIQPNTPQPGLEMVTVTVPAGSNHRLFGRIKASLP